MEKKIFNLLKLLFLIKFLDTKRCNFKNDEVIFIIEKNIFLLNDILKEFLVIKFENNSYFFEVINDKIISTNIYKIIKILTLNRQDIYWYCDNNFDLKTKIYIKYFFWIILEDIKDFNIIIKYIKTQNDPILKEILYVFYYWFFLVNKKNMLISIWLLDNLIKKFPNISTFHLLKIRQRFECFYRYWITKTIFNKMVLNKEWKDKLLNNLEMKTLFNEINYIENNFSDPISDLFIWKIYLHLLDERWIDKFNSYFLKTGLTFDEDIFSWLWVYYLQIWDLQKAKTYLKKLNFVNYEPYKIISKYIFITILENNFLDFFDEIKKYEIIFFINSCYYIYENNSFKPINFCDKYDNKTKLWFKLDKIDFNTQNEKMFFESVFKNISKNFYDHFVIQDFDKMIINYK